MMEWLWWYLFGLGSGIGLTALYQSLSHKNIALRWYERLLSILAVAIIIFAVQTFFGSYAEYQPKAAWLSLLSLALPTAILIVATIRSVQGRMKKEL